MAEWHLPPDYIVNNWTDELLDLMTEKLVERKQRENQAMKTAIPSRGQKVPDTVLFAKAENLVRVEKK